MRSSSNGCTVCMYQPLCREANVTLRCFSSQDLQEYFFDTVFAVLACEMIQPIGICPAAVGLSSISSPNIGQW